MSLIEFFKLGGPFMWPLLLFSIIGIAYIMERGYVFFKTDLKAIKEINELFHKLKKKDIDGAKKLLQENEKNCIMSVLNAGLKMINQPLAQMEKSMEAESKIKIREIERGLNVLVVLGNIAPLTGFLGTVSGMIQAFKSIAVADEVSTQLVASGIYEALITTAFGLSIAIVVISAYNYFIHKVDDFASDVERVSNEMMEILIEKGLK